MKSQHFILLCCFRITQFKYTLKPLFSTRKLNLKMLILQQVDLVNWWTSRLNNKLQYLGFVMCTRRILIKSIGWEQKEQPLRGSYRRQRRAGELTKLISIGWDSLPATTTLSPAVWKLYFICSFMCYLCI